jgi:hypothetical protein
LVIHKEKWRLKNRKINVANEAFDVVRADLLISKKRITALVVFPALQR